MRSGSSTRLRRLRGRAGQAVAAGEVAVVVRVEPQARSDRALARSGRQIARSRAASRARVELVRRARSRPSGSSSVVQRRFSIRVAADAGSPASTTHVHRPGMSRTRVHDAATSGAPRRAIASHSARIIRSPAPNASASGRRPTSAAASPALTPASCGGHAMRADAVAAPASADTRRMISSLAAQVERRRPEHLRRRSGMVAGEQLGHLREGAHDRRRLAVRRVERARQERGVGGLDQIDGAHRRDCTVRRCRIP